MGTPQPLVPLRWLTEAIAERDRLEALNAELLELLKRQREGFATLGEELAWDDYADAAIAKAEGK